MRAAHGGDGDRAADDGEGERESNHKRLHNVLPIRSHTRLKSGERKRDRQLASAVPVLLEILARVMMQVPGVFAKADASRPALLHKLRVLDFVTNTTDHYFACTLHECNAKFFVRAYKF